MRSRRAAEPSGGSDAGPPAGDVDEGDQAAAEIVPESELERRILSDELVVKGLEWGEPRDGHPEGAVGNHVAHLLATIDDWEVPEPRRSELRLISILHDAMKRRVVEWLPRSGPNHHAVRARRLAERYTSDERLLATIEFHDRPYGFWRQLQRTGRLDLSDFDRMLGRVPDHGLLLQFIELDGSTEGKDPEPVRWFREMLAERGGTSTS